MAAARFDGALRRADFKLTSTQRDPAGNTTLTRFWLHNFPDGLPAGDYTFTGHWLEGCQDAVDDGLYPGPCPNPNAPVEIFSNSLTVTFTP